MQLFRVPEFLIVQLKRYRSLSASLLPPRPPSHPLRFRGTGGTSILGREKLETLVQYPVAGLDLAPWLTGAHGPCLYDLYAVSVRGGGGGAS
jgi:hypothetical protein